MIIIRDVFHCNPGQHMQVAEKFKTAIATFDYGDKSRVLVDVAADFWTVVVEYHVDDLGDWERFKAETIAKPELQKVIAGYRELVQTGRREIYRTV